tara:strand:+ start:214 stop:894 length:681 start_codon:yes stop_codon:yes gene_type:complete
LIKRNILFVVAHSDDETIGAGSSIRKHVLNGDTVSVIAMTDGVSSRSLKDKNAPKIRKLAAQNAAQILGFDWIGNYDFPDNQMDTHSLLEVVKIIEDVKEELRPELVYTHSGSDLNIDHRIVAEAVVTACRPQPKECVKEIRMFEVPSSTDYGHNSLFGDFVPNLFINAEKNWEEKIAALAAYKNEMREHPHSRSMEGIENLARYRGNQVGLKLAEAFQVIRKIEL